MTETLDMKVTISAVATPTLYRAMMSVASPRQRAALLKRIAEDYLRGSSELTSRSESPAFETPLTRNGAHELLKGQSSAPALAQQQNRPIPAAQGEAPARYTPASAQENSQGIAIEQRAPALSLAVPEDDDAHYDFLERSLAGFG